MSEELTLDVGQANELKLAFRRANWTNVDIKRLSEGKLLSTILPVVRGQADVVIKRHVIDCDADPFVPEGWQIEEHKRGGQLAFDTTKIGLYYISKGQQRGKIIPGYKIRGGLKKQPVLNGCVLDYLLSHQELIPDEWKGKCVFFWGTIYRHSDGDLGVCCLCWCDSYWSRHLDLIGALGGGGPAAVAA